MSMLNLGPKFSWLKNLNLSFQKQICIRISKSSPLGTIFTFVLVSFLLITQVGGQSLNIISPLFQQKASIGNLMRTLGLENKIKANAQNSTQSYFTIQSTDASGAGYKLSTNDSTASEGSNVKFTNSQNLDDQQKWFFDSSQNLIKSAIGNKCLATSQNQIYQPIIIKTCNASDNTQVWDIGNNLLKNLTTGKCANAAWSQVTGTTYYENRWFEGRNAQLDDSCDWSFRFDPLPSGSSISSNVLSSVSNSISQNSTISSSVASSVSFGNPIAQSFYTIESTDAGGTGYKLTTSDSAGTENSFVKFTNIVTINDQQKWFFDPASKLIKSAIVNKCLATIANQVYTNLVLKNCNANDNTQIWDTANELIKNLATGKCAVPSWTQNSTNQAWENRWYDGRTAGLDDGCGWGFRFLPQAVGNSNSSSLSSTISSSTIPSSSSSSVSKVSANSSLPAQVATQQFFTIDTLDPTGTGYKLTTTDSAGTENSFAKFTNIATINDQQKWFFDPASKLIKSAIVNKCLATTNNQVWQPTIIKTCNPSDNTQIWDIAGNVIKNLATNNCVAASWSQIGTTANYENKWYDGRLLSLDNSCYWSYKFNPIIFSNQSSSISNSSSVSSSSFVSIAQPTILTYKENGIDLNVSVACTDDGEMVSGQQSFSMVVQYTNNGGRVEVVNSRLIPDRPVIHTHFDRKDKDTLNYSDVN